MEEDNYLFDDYFDKINLNDELINFYKIINDENLNETFLEESKLSDFRNENFQKYLEIKLSNFQNLPLEFKDIVDEINKLYSFIDLSNILIEDYEHALETKKILDLITTHVDELNRIIVNELNLLESKNNDRQNKLKQMNYAGIDKNNLSIFLNKYNQLVLFNATIVDDIYDSYKRQLKRKKYLNELYRLIDIESDTKDNNDLLKRLNIDINEKINKINNNLLYLEDIMISDSKYKKEFKVLKNYFINLIAYDDKNYTDVYRVYNLLSNDFKIKSLLNYFEDSFIKEVEEIKKEEQFIYEKYGIKNIRTSLDYISANYMDLLSEEEKSLIECLYSKVNSDKYNLTEVYNRLNLLTNNIWRKTITDVYSYNRNDEFYFICTNNQFIDEKHQAILITSRMLDKVDDYSDYQMGFICDFNDNLLYITENNDIMTVNYNDMSNLKTPKQIEQEFINFKVCNRVALNGYVTKISAVYFINDGDIIKYKKAVELSNQYKLPLIVLKKDI